MKGVSQSFLRTKIVQEDERMDQLASAIDEVLESTQTLSKKLEDVEKKNKQEKSKVEQQRQQLLIQTQVRMHLHRVAVIS